MFEPIKKERLSLKNVPQFSSYEHRRRNNHFFKLCEKKSGEFLLNKHDKESLTNKLFSSKKHFFSPLGYKIKKCVYLESLTAE